jgi:dTMP kinase
VAEARREPDGVLPDDDTVTSHGDVPLPPPHSLADPRPPRSAVVRLFGSDDFFRLWIAQVVSALGDWLGFVAIVAIATRVGGDSPAGAISLVMSARLVPGFFLAPVAGVLVDRWDRKKVMVTCDLARAGVLMTLPFIDEVWTLVLASLLLEVATLLWSPAKEATVPNLVPSEHLTTANSLSLAAAYGTFPVASLLFALLAKVADWLGGFDALEGLRLNQATIAIWVDVVTFTLSAFIISTILIPRRRGRRDRQVRIDVGATLRELREGWRFMFINPIVRAIMIGIGTGLIGGGMVVPLGDVFSRQVLGGGSAGFGLLLTALGFGMAAGVVTLSAFQRRLPKEPMFCWSVIGASVALWWGAASGSLTPAMVAVSLLGVFAGAVYVLGFTILHENVDDAMRGRVFSSLYTLVRFCLLLSFAVGPLLSDLLDPLFPDEVSLGATTLELPGVRLALWLASSVIFVAGVMALWAFRRGDSRAGSGAGA